MNKKGKHFRRMLKFGDGFTLLELLIALTILGVVLSMLFASFKMGVTAWEKGEEKVASLQRKRVVLDLVKRQLTSICSVEIKKTDTDSYFMKGDEKYLEFLSNFPIMPAEFSGIVRVTYVVTSVEGDNGKSLGLYEKQQGDNHESDEERFYPLIKKAFKIEFEYFKSEEDGARSWENIWDPEVDKGLPLAIRISVWDDQNTMPVNVIAKIMQNAHGK
ncbi:MAG TPA: hypothetical protein DD405_02305 [Desulfobacteraceae bacterium]|nr:hypothetical protein [Desulfobacteraceae bacterium]